MRKKGKAVTDYELKKLAYIQHLLGEDQGIDPSKTVWLGSEVMSLSEARDIASTGILPNPYLIEKTEFVPNGMGPQGIVGRALVPDRFPMLLPRHCLESIGDAHDLRYALGGTRNARARADNEFKRLIQIAGRRLSWYKRFRLWRISWVYFAFVRGFGKRCFNFITRRK